MNPILGIVASSISGNLNNNSYESIATVTVGAGQQISYASFGSIPNTYKHLQIRATMTCTNANNMLLRVGVGSIDTAANYSWHQLYGDGSNVYGNGNASQTYGYVGYNYNTAYPNIAIIDILDYANTNKYKTWKSLAGQDNNGSGFAQLWSGNWRSTSAIDCFRIDPSSGNFNEYSSFALYGVKG